MAKVKIQGNASGTGVITLIAPNTDTDRTVTLPDESITLGGGVDGIVSTADATAITISSSEDVGINHSTGFGTYSGTGVKYSKGDGTFFIGRDGGQPLWLNRETSQGDLIGLAAIGATKARIGIDGDDFIIKTSTGGNTERLRITDDGRGLSQFTAKAWINFNGTSTAAIRDSHNISSLTDNGTGDYTVAYTNAVGAGNSVALSTAYVDNSGKGSMAWFGNAAVGTTSYRFYTRHHDNASMDSDTVTGITFGD